MTDVNHIISVINGAKLVTDPYPYFYAEGVFSDDDYEMLLARVPVDSEGQKYKKRRMMEFDAGLGDEFMQAILQKFGKSGEYRHDTRLVLDRENYAIGPHTDKKTKAASLLFYLPTDNSDESIGTSIYTPKDKSFRCPGGIEYKEFEFDKIWTAPFRRNSLFAFWKTDNSFHGVEKIRRPITRNVLLYNVYHV